MSAAKKGKRTIVRQEVKSHHSLDSWDIYHPKSSGGFTRREFDEPTCRFSKYTLSLYACPGLEVGATVTIATKERALAVIVDPDGKLKMRSPGKKANGNKLICGSKAMMTTLNGPGGTYIFGEKVTIDGKTAFVFNW